ncbi:cell division protein FtsI [Novosphingobium sp. MBES04]|nr:cell division protein FtsI [Novosphingobium sp. MBES04]
MTALALQSTVPVTVSTGSRGLVNERQRSLLMAKARTLWVLVAFVLVGMIAALRIAYLGTTGPSPREVRLADLLTPQRGEIVDRNGAPLARDFRVYSLWFNPKAMTEGEPLIHSPKEIAAGLARIFPDIDQDEVIEKLSSGKAGYIRKSLLPEDANRVHELGEPALEFPLETTRYYPQGSLAAHVLGYVDSYGHGKVGMEQYFDKELVSPEGRSAPSVISIDFRVQSALEDELAKGMALSEAKGAAGVVLDVDTGEVMALASLPGFDPNHVKPNDMVVTPEEAKEGEVPKGFNRATNQVYELGSTFKPITVAAALDAGTVTNLARRWPAAPLHVGRFTIKDSHAMGASLNVPETLIHSSNVVTAQIADELGGERLKAKLKVLGMNTRPAIELPARGFPIWDNGKWRRLRTMTVSYGHGVAVTPLHLATAYAALVNGGMWRPATLRKLSAGEVPEAPGVQRGDLGAYPPAFAHDRALRYGPQGRCAGLPDRWQDRLGGKAGQRGVSPPLADFHVRGGLPHGQAALCRHSHDGRAQGYGGDQLPAHRRLERSAGGGARGPAYRAAPGHHARRDPRYRHLGSQASHPP